MLHQVRWGILGCGDVTEVKSGPLAMNRDDGTSRVVACMRRDGDKAADYARRHGVDRSYDDVDALIADDEVNAVYIATPPGSHRDIALKVAAAGKACYVEKPMARTYAECREMADAFRSAGQPLFVAYYRRRLPRFTMAKRLIDEGRLGTITGVHYEMARPYQPDREHGWRAEPKISGGGLFLDLGSHLLDLLDFLLGPLGDVAGASFGKPGEDRVAMSFSHPGDIVGTARWNFAAARSVDQILIEGTAATLKLSCFGTENLTLTGGDGNVETFDGSHDRTVQRYLLDDIIAHLRGTGESPSTGDSAARTNLAMDIALGRVS